MLLISDRIPLSQAVSGFNFGCDETQCEKVLKHQLKLISLKYIDKTYADVTFQIWDQKQKVNNIDIEATDQHGKVYDDGKF